MNEASLAESTGSYESTLIRQAVEGRPAAVEAVCRLHQPRISRTVVAGHGARAGADPRRGA